MRTSGAFKTGMQEKSSRRLIQGQSAVIEEVHGCVPERVENNKEFL